MQQVSPIERMTRQRRIILEEMRTPGRHLTADDVYGRVRKQIPNISLGTVYRNLEVLVQAGRIRKLTLGGGQKQYDGGVHKHYHIRCSKCGLVTDVSAKAFPDLDKAATGGVDGFEITGHELEFIGICEKCKKKFTTKERKDKK